MGDDKRNDSKDSEEIMDISKAVAETLKMLNDVLFEQQQSIGALASGICHEMINLAKEVNSISEEKVVSDEQIKTIEQVMKEKADKIQQSIKNAGLTMKNLLDDNLGSHLSNSFYRSAAVHALSNACHNAVSAQQQANEIAQAAVSEGVSGMYSIIMASLGKAENSKLEKSS